MKVTSAISTEPTTWLWDLDQFFDIMENSEGDLLQEDLDENERTLQALSQESQQLDAAICTGNPGFSIDHQIIAYSNSELPANDPVVQNYHGNPQSSIAQSASVNHPTDSGIPVAWQHVPSECTVFERKISPVEGFQDPGSWPRRNVTSIHPRGLDPMFAASAATNFQHTAGRNQCHPSISGRQNDLGSFGHHKLPSLGQEALVNSFSLGHNTRSVAAVVHPSAKADPALSAGPNQQTTQLIANLSEPTTWKRVAAQGNETQEIGSWPVPEEQTQKMPPAMPNPGFQTIVGDASLLSGHGSKPRQCNQKGTSRKRGHSHQDMPSLDLSKVEFPVSDSHEYTAGEPLRPLSAYNYFFRDERDRALNPDNSPPLDFTFERAERLLKDHWNSAFETSSRKRSHRKSHGKISFTDLSKLVSKRWKELPDGGREYFKQIASADFKRFQSQGGHHPTKRRRKH